MQTRKLSAVAHASERMFARKVLEKDVSDKDWLAIEAIKDS